LREQARTWLAAELEEHARLLQAGKREDRWRVTRWLTLWRADPDLAGLRDPAAVAGLPADERTARERLWAEVASLYAKASAAD
jgi:hypothetical protein